MEEAHYWKVSCALSCTVSLGFPGCTWRKPNTSTPYPAVRSTHCRYLSSGMDVSSDTPGFTLCPAELQEKPGPTWQRRDGRKKPASSRGWPCGRRRCWLHVATPCWSPSAPCATATLSTGSWCTTMCGLSSTTRTSDRAPASETSSLTTSGARGWRTTRATSPTDRCASSPSSKFGQLCFFWRLNWTSDKQTVYASLC